MFKIALLWGGFAPSTSAEALPLDPAGGLGGPHTSGLLHPYFSFSNVGISVTGVWQRVGCIRQSHIHSV